MAKIPENITSHYSDYYEDGVTSWRTISAREKAKNIIDLCNSYSHDNVVEIGAGDGSVLQQLSESKFAKRYAALEVSESAVDLIRDRNIDELDRVDLYDGKSMPADDSEYDLSILSHVVEHVEDPRSLLREAARVSDYLCIEVPLELMWRTPRDFKWSATGHINLYSPLTIRQLIQSTGLEVVREQVTLPSYASHRFSAGRSAIVKYGLKWGTLKTWPFLATQLFSYHWSALCRPTTTD